MKKRPGAPNTGSPKENSFGDKGLRFILLKDSLFFAVGIVKGFIFRSVLLVSVGITFHGKGFGSTIVRFQT
jgi:hypothetical protein